MEQRNIGSQGLKTTKLGYGCMGLTAFYGHPMDDDEAAEVIVKCYQLGVTHFDTAEMYRQADADGVMHYNEVVLGKALKKIGRDNVTIATKYAPSLHEGKWSREIMRQALDDSMKRLDVSVVDLYYLHRMYPESVVPIEDVVKVMGEFVTEGKVKYIGLSEASAEWIRRAHAVHPITAVQQEWSLMTRDLEDDIVPTCRELGIGIVAYSPVCRGLLTGEIKGKDDLKSGNDFRGSTPRFSGDNLDNNLALVNKVSEIAQRKNITPAQLALAWVMAQGNDVMPIPGTTKIHHLESNVAAAKVELSESELQEIASTLQSHKVAGERYAPQAMAACYNNVCKKE